MQPINREDQETTLACIGKFDQSGLPIVTSRHLSPYATVTFQVLTLKTLFERSIAAEPLQSVYINHEDGSRIRIDRTPDGFVAYLLPTETAATPPPTP